MHTLDPGGEWLRLSNYYRQLTDSTLLDLARRPSDLTDIAQQVLTQEVTSRRLKIPPKEPAAKSREPRPPWMPDSASDGNSPYADDRELVTICDVWSAMDALKLQHLLDGASIPFYIGPEKATGVDEVTSDFSKGLAVQIMRVGLPWAYPLFQDYFPNDVPPEELAVEPDNLAIRCPRCGSTEIVFETLDQNPPISQSQSRSKFKWTCDACGHQWEDEGLLTEN